MLKLMEIKEMSLSELQDTLCKSKLELVDLKMKFQARQLEDPSLISKKRKEIARILTINAQKLSKKGAKGTSQEIDEEPKKLIKSKTKKARSLLEKGK